MSLILETEPGPIADDAQFFNIAGYQAIVLKRHAELLEKLGSDQVIVFRGEIFCVERLAKLMLNSFSSGQFESVLRRKFEANTGIDCTAFYVDGELQPLAAATILEAFLDGSDLGRYQEGQRYFFGHPLPV